MISTDRDVRIGVLASGSGSNLQALLDHFHTPVSAGARVVWVGSNRSEAGALSRATEAGVKATVIQGGGGDGAALLATLRAERVEVLVLAGYLKLIPAAVVQAYRGHILNVHPALLPAFGGPGMYGHHVHNAVLAHGATISGATVHFVDEHFDRGAIAAQWPVRVHANDTAASLAARVLAVEHQLLPWVVSALVLGHIALNEDGALRGEVPLPEIPHPFR